MPNTKRIPLARIGTYVGSSGVGVGSSGVGVGSTRLFRYQQVGMGKANLMKKTPGYKALFMFLILSYFVMLCVTAFTQMTKTIGHKSHNSQQLRILQRFSQISRVSSLYPAKQLIG